MIFVYIKSNIQNYFCIALTSEDNEQYKTFYQDKDIADYIGISLDEYQEELLQFNGVYAFEILFYKRHDVQQAIKYMNEKYRVLLALIK